MNAWFLALVMLSAPPAGAAKEPAPPPARETVASAEDVLAGAQFLAALGAGATVGVVALIPATAVVGVTAVVAWSNGAPLLLLPVTVALLSGVLVVQAVAAGLAVWAVSLASTAYRPRPGLPPPLHMPLRSWLAPLPAALRPLVGLAGLPFVHGAAGYLVGGVLGALVAVALAGPLLLVATWWARSPSPPPLAAAGLIGALVFAAALVVAIPLVLAPASSVAAAQLAREPVEDAP